MINCILMALQQMKLHWRSVQRYTLKSLCSAQQLQPSMLQAMNQDFEVCGTSASGQHTHGETQDHTMIVRWLLKTTPSPG